MGGGVDGRIWAGVDEEVPHAPHTTCSGANLITLHLPERSRTRAEVTVECVMVPAKQSLCDSCVLSPSREIDWINAVSASA
jgi:hypothetical protein